jgi:LPS O-antigen subunit length determinant protein (WzzB/FepE family)
MALIELPDFSVFPQKRHKHGPVVRTQPSRQIIMVCWLLVFSTGVTAGLLLSLLAVVLGTSACPVQPAAAPAPARPFAALIR